MNEKRHLFSAQSPSHTAQAASPTLLGRMLARIRPQSESIQRFTIKEELGSGCMGEIYRATDNLTGADIALKVAYNAHESRVAAKNELRAIGGLRHENLVNILGNGRFRDGQFEGRTFIILEFVDGKDLGTIITEGRGVPAPSVRPVLLGICNALSAAHGSGIVHMDVKPSNILVAGDTAKLADFGVSMKTGTSQLSLFQPTFMAGQGNLSYAAPEMFSLDAKADPRIDIYALGMVALHAVGGETPAVIPWLDANAKAAIRRSIGRLPGGVSDIVSKAVCAIADERYQSAQEMADAVRRNWPAS